MDILVTRSGGFTGLTEQLGPVHVGNLPKPVAGQISAIVTRIDFFELPGDLGGEPIADDFTYSMTIRDDDRDHEVRWNETSESPHRADLQEIVSLLESADVAWQPKDRQGD